MQMVLISLDLALQVFSIHGLNAQEKTIFRKQLRPIKFWCACNRFESASRIEHLVRCLA